MKQSKSNDFAIHIFHGHIYKCICNAAFILCFSPVFPFALHISHVSLCGTVLTWGWSQGTGACKTGLITPPWKRRHRSQLIQAPSLSRGMRVDRFILFTSFTTCMFNLIKTNACVYEQCLLKLKNLLI